MIFVTLGTQDKKFPRLLQALDKAKTIMKANLIGTIIKTITLFILLYLDISMYALLISILLQHTYITIIEYKKIKETLS